MLPTEYYSRSNVLLLGCTRNFGHRSRRAGSSRGSTSANSSKRFHFGTGDVIDGLEARQVVVGEHDAARLERTDRGDDVLDLEAQRRVRGLGAAGFREERKLGSAAAVYEFAARLGADGFEAKLLAVEAACALQIDDREHATDLRAFQNVAAWCGCVHVVSLSLRSTGEAFTLRAGAAYTPLEGHDRAIRVST